MGTSAWIAAESASDLPSERLERVVSLGAVSTPELSSTEREGPQAYLVAQGSATGELPVHFHTVDQFQYFAHGRGVVGAHEVAHGRVHYADALAPYGPLRPGGPGMSYLTLRAVHDGGVRYMPESREELRELLEGADRRPGDRRNVAIDLTGAVEPGRWHHLREDPDGLRISVLDPTPGTEAPRLVVGSGGAYAVVVTGAVDDRSVRMGPGAHRWLDAGEVLEVDGGPERARIAVLQFPRRPLAAS